MSGIAGLKSRIEKCQRKMSILHRKPIQSFVYMEKDGTLLWEEGIDYNDSGVLAVPLPMTMDEWEKFCLG